MNNAIRRRVISFGLAIVVLALMIGWAANITWRQVEELNTRLTTVQIESFQIADQFRASLEELDYTLLRYQIHREPADWNEFLAESHKLDRWIDAQRPLMTSGQERKIMGAINDAYDDYLKAARAINESDPASKDALGLDNFSNVERESKRLRAFEARLLAAHRTSLTTFLAASHTSLVMLRNLTFGALFLLLVLGMWLASVVYREMITPLNRKLIESHAIIERQEKLASLGVLAAGVAHEIRNPLTAIKARLFTQQKALTKDSPEYADAVVIGGEINRLERIVKDFLQFARPSEPQLTELKPGTALREVRDLLAPQLERENIRILLEEETDSRVNADPQQIKQVLINLVQNAADSMGGAGRIILRSREGRAALRGHEWPVVIMEVSDTGRGIPLEIQKRLFDPFFSTKEGGTGLGLSIAARIVEKHGGALEFQTMVNRGTTFGIVLPMLPAHANGS